MPSSFIDRLNGEHPMPHRSTALFLFAIAFVVLPIRGALAAPGESSSPAQEDALIRHGLELRERHDDAGALAEFQRAFRLSSGGQALAQVALAEQALGRWVDAETHLTEALRHGDDRWIVRNDKLLRQSLFTIQGHTGSLEITGPVTGAEILVNNESVGTFPMPPVLVPAGSVALEVRARGYLPVVRTVVIPARGLARESIVLVAAPVAPPIDVAPPTIVPAPAPGSETNAAAAPTIPTSNEAAAPADSGWSGRTKVGVAIAAAGVASLGLGIAYQIIREQRAGAFNSHDCGVTADVVTGPSDCPSRYDGIKGAQKVAIGGFAGAAVLGGVGIYLILSGGSSSSDAVTAHVSLLLRCLPAAGFGVTCAARF
jgi:hypothetical protein